ELGPALVGCTVAVVVDAVAQRLIREDAVGHDRVCLDAVRILAKPRRETLARVALERDVRAQRAGGMPAARSGTRHHQRLVDAPIAIVVGAVADFRGRRADGTLVLAARLAVEIDEACEAIFDYTRAVDTRSLGVFALTDLVATTAVARVAREIE